MSTRGYIGRLNEDGSVDAIYNHFDSYFDELGKDLLKNFDTKEKVDALIARGSGSYVLDEEGYNDEPKSYHYDSIDDYLNELDHDIFAEYIYLFTTDNNWLGKNHLCGKQYVSENEKGYFWDFELLSKILSQTELTK